VWRKAFPTYDEQGWGVALQLDRRRRKPFWTINGSPCRQTFRHCARREGVQSAPVIRRTDLWRSCFDYRRLHRRKRYAIWRASWKIPCKRRVTVEEERSVSATLGSDSIRSGCLRWLGWFGAELSLHHNLLSICRPGSQYRADSQSRTAFRSDGDVQLRPDATRNSRHHSHNRHGCGRKRVDLRTASGRKLATGKPLNIALNAAYDRAFSAILDSNVTTLITALILFWESNRTGQRFRRNAHNRHRRIDVFPRCSWRAIVSTGQSRVAFLNALPCRI